jgi:hypothetical protein
MRKLLGQCSFCCGEPKPVVSTLREVDHFICEACVKKVVFTFKITRIGCADSANAAHPTDPKSAEERQHINQKPSAKMIHTYAAKHGHSAYQTGMPLPTEDHYSASPCPKRSAFIDELLKRLRGTKVLDEVETATEQKEAA